MKLATKYVLVIVFGVLFVITLIIMLSLWLSGVFDIDSETPTPLPSPNICQSIDKRLINFSTNTSTDTNYGYVTQGNSDGSYLCTTSGADFIVYKLVDDAYITVYNFASSGKPNGTPILYTTMNDIYSIFPFTTSGKLRLYYGSGENYQLFTFQDFPEWSSCTAIQPSNNTDHFIGSFQKDSLSQIVSFSVHNSVYHIINNGSVFSANETLVTILEPDKISVWQFKDGKYGVEAITSVHKPTGSSEQWGSQHTLSQNSELLLISDINATVNTKTNAGLVTIYKKSSVGHDYIELQTIFESNGAVQNSLFGSNVQLFSNLLVFISGQQTVGSTRTLYVYSFNPITNQIALKQEIGGSNTGNFGIQFHVDTSTIQDRMHLSFGQSSSPDKNIFNFLGFCT